MSIQLDKTYSPAETEAAASRIWREEKCFAADPSAPGEPYTIVIPPPNVTGALHLGHAINNTLQDILTRQHRMRGFNTLWVPGIDHAGIATQAVVEKQLKEKENKTRNDIGREELVRRIWQWKEQYGNRIIEQLQRLGCSCDWDRTRFTLDDMCARAVRETFFKLFKDGLIYRGKRLVNWDTHLETSISDDEVYHETVKTSLWHIRYPIVEVGFTAENAQKKPGNEFSAISAPSAVQSPDSRPKFLTVATTRPETMLGDTAVAVHSADPRWNWAIGKQVQLPLTNRLIPIIADDILVDPEFGSGVVKVTPAHDPNDYAVWQRHQGKPDQIDLINILNPDGTLNENAGAYKGMKRDAARKKVVEDLTAQGLLAKEEPYETEVGHSDRSKTAIEPYLSDQWFVQMAPLAEPALQAVRDGTIKFFPERHAQQFLSWLGEKRDWPISRQLWWGHRIPVWRGLGRELSPEHADRLRNKRVSDETTIESFSDSLVIQSGIQEDFDQCEAFVCIAPGHPELERQFQERGFTQDPDVLDTWFSSALWPHSTLGWPEQTPELKKYYPTSVLLTGRDIITLWVARMVMTGMYNMGEHKHSPSPGAKDERHVGWAYSPTESPDGRVSPSNTDAADRARRLGIPFHHVAINPTILDGKGERMSKSKGNGVDPVEIIDAYGADALRFTLTLMATETQDVRMPVKKDAQGRNTSEKFEIGRRLANKIWNAARMAFDNLQTIAPAPVDQTQWSVMDRWIIGRFNAAVRDADAALAAYRFDQYAQFCYDFFWRDFCDWYLEAIKPALKNPATAPQTANVLAAVLDGLLRLLHPATPFITETLWQRLNELRPQRGLPGALECPPSKRLIKAAWPKTAPGMDGGEVISTIQDFVAALRNLRNEHKIDPRTKVDVAIVPTPALKNLLAANVDLIQQFGTCNVTFTDHASANAARLSVAGCDLFVAGLADQATEQHRSEKRREELTRQRATLKGRLDNPGYVAKAPPQLVEQTQSQLAEVEAELAKLG